jgi:hypothetical protein
MHRHQSFVSISTSMLTERLGRGSRRWPEGFLEHHLDAPTNLSAAGPGSRSDCYEAGLLMVIQAAWLMAIGDRAEGAARADGHPLGCSVAGNS